MHTRIKACLNVSFLLSSAPSPLKKDEIYKFCFVEQTETKGMMAGIVTS